MLLEEHCEDNDNDDEEEDGEHDHGDVGHDLQPGVARRIAVEEVEAGGAAAVEAGVAALAEGGVGLQLREGAFQVDALEKE